jgi:hypothetical protein
LTESVCDRERRRFNLARTSSAQLTASA